VVMEALTRGAGHYRYPHQSHRHRASPCPSQLHPPTSSLLAALAPFHPRLEPRTHPLLHGRTRVLLSTISTTETIFKTSLQVRLYREDVFVQQMFAPWQSSATPPHRNAIAIPLHPTPGPPSPRGAGLWKGLHQRLSFAGL
jgi:hypothetical protein